MPNLDLEQLKSLIKEEKWDEAKKIIEDYINGAEMTQEEKGSLYVNIASTYMDFINKINGEYEKSLDEALKIIDTLDKQEEELKDVENMAAVREQLKKVNGK